MQETWTVALDDSTSSGTQPLWYLPHHAHTVPGKGAVDPGKHGTVCLDEPTSSGTQPSQYLPRHACIVPDKGAVDTGKHMRGFGRGNERSPRIHF